MPIPLEIAPERLAYARLFVELNSAIHSSIAYPEPSLAGGNDANLNLVAAAVLVGHAEGKPMNQTKLAEYLNMPRSTVIDRLKRLVDLGVIVEVDGLYYLEPQRAKHVPLLDTFIDIFRRAFAVIGPFLERLSKSGT